MSEDLETMIRRKQDELAIREYHRNKPLWERLLPWGRWLLVIAVALYFVGGLIVFVAGISQ